MASIYMNALPFSRFVQFLDMRRYMSRISLLRSLPRFFFMYHNALKSSKTENDYGK